jgi:hypothetical protein
VCGSEALVVSACIGECQGLDNLRRVSCMGSGAGSASRRGLFSSPSRSEKRL